MFSLVFRGEIEGCNDPLFFFYFTEMDKNLTELIEYYEKALVDKQSQVTELKKLRSSNNFMACTAKYIKEINKLLAEIKNLHLKINRLKLKI